MPTYITDPTCPEIAIERGVQYITLLPDMLPPLEIVVSDDVVVSDSTASEFKLTKLAIFAVDQVHVTDELLLPLRIFVFDRVTVSDVALVTSPQLRIFVYDEVFVTESPMYPYPGGLAPTIPNQTAVYTDFWAVGPRGDE